MVGMSRAGLEQGFYPRAELWLTSSPEVGSSPSAEPSAHVAHRPTDTG